MSLLLSLGGGIGLITLANLLLLRLTPLSARQTAIATGTAALGIYLPMAILAWPGADVFAIHLAIYLLASMAFGMLASSRERVGPEGARGGGKPIHLAPALIIGFFVCIVIVDAGFVMVAEQGLPPGWLEKLLPQARYADNVSSAAFPGVISHDFQKQQGLYNNYLRQVEEQQARGWQIRKGWLGTPVLNEPAVFQVVATTPDGKPLSDTEITGRFLRPSDSHLDTAFAMAEIAPGTYQASLSLPAAGMWNLVMQLRRGDELHEIRASTSVQTP
jgi:nitrogen fixation protein FixH